MARVQAKPRGYPPVSPTDEDRQSVDPAVQELREADAPAEEIRPVPSDRKTAPDAGTEAGISKAPAKEVKKPQKLRHVLLLVGPVIVVIGGLYFYLSGGYVSTDNAYVKMDKLNITTDVSGIIAGIPVKDNQRVQQGQLLFRMDDEPYRIALAAAEAQLGTVRTEIANLQAT